MRKYRVLFVVDHHPPEPVYGYDRWALSLSRELASRDHEITVATQWFSDEAPQEETIEGVGVRRFRLREVPDRLWMLGRSIRSRGIRPLLTGIEGKYDVIIGLPNYIVFASQLAPSVKRIYQAGGTLLGAEQWEQYVHPGGTLRERFFAWLSWRQLLHYERAAIRRSDLVIVPSENIKEQLKYYYRTKPGDVGVIPHGADLDAFSPAAREPDGTLRIVSIGRLNSIKNHKLLVDAVALAENRKNMQVHVVGEGSLRKPLEKQIAELGLEDTVKLVGYTDDVEMEYKWADVFAHPSICEPFGIVLVEAMSCELPFVGLKRRPPDVWVANDEIIEDGVTGMLVPDGDPRRFAEALDRFARRSDLCRQMGQAARRRVAELFTWSRVARMYEETFQELVQDG